LAEPTTTPCWLFSDLADKLVVMQFEERQGSSDGGALLLKAADRRLGLTRALAAGPEDGRQAGKVEHGLDERLRQRGRAIACGYEDAHAAARLASGPVHRLLVGRDPGEGADLASQPTLWRFENTPDRKPGARHRRRLQGRARGLPIDLDPTDDPTHGAQPWALFNGPYDTWGYLPLRGFLSFNDEPEQYLFTAGLRSGKAVAWQGARGILRRWLKKLRRAFPGVRIRIRLDGGFAAPRLLDFLDAPPDVKYVVAMAKNAGLQRQAKRPLRQARRLSRRTGKTAHLYPEAFYAARPWSHRRRRVIKAEIVRQAGKHPKDNPRFLIPNLRQTPAWRRLLAHFAQQAPEKVALSL